MLNFIFCLSLLSLTGGPTGLPCRFLLPQRGKKGRGGVVHGGAGGTVLALTQCCVASREPLLLRPPFYPPPILIPSVHTHSEREKGGILFLAGGGCFSVASRTTVLDPSLAKVIDLLLRSNLSLSAPAWSGLCAVES